jgi:hypothetical protein
LMEQIGLVWDVKRPKLAQDPHEQMPDEKISSGNASVDTVGGNIPTVQPAFPVETIFRRQ